ncbi:MAG: hypothetical protein LBJ02_10685 [Bifidobacteriaceae bacterium]|jgi:hypothetical protein|nr:hypothetical protein [Bifidobacteriaceae bacterium]
MRRRLALRLAAVTAMGLILAACADSGEDADLDDAADAYSRAIWSLTEKYTQECMASLGFEYQVGAYEPAASATAASLSPYGFTVEEAEAHGFGAVDGVLSGLDSEVAASGDAEASGDGTPEGYDLALYGDGSRDGGCAVQATGRAYSEIDPEDYPAIRDRMAVVEAMLADPRYSAFWESWSSCAAEQGLEAADASEVESDFQDRAAKLEIIEPPIFDEATGEVTEGASTVRADVAHALRQEEIAAAVVTVQCLEPLREQWEQIITDAEKG